MTADQTRALDYLDVPVREDDATVIEYVAEQVLYGNRTASDVAHLMATAGRIIRTVRPDLVPAIKGQDA